MFTELKLTLSIIKEIKNGEWVPYWIEHREHRDNSGKIITAYKKGNAPFTGPELWLGNGALFCDVLTDRYNNGNHLLKNPAYCCILWYGAARKLKKYHTKLHGIELS